MNTAIQNGPSGRKCGTLRSITPSEDRWEFAEDVNSIHQRPDTSEEEVTHLASSLSDPSDFMSPRDTLPPLLVEEPIRTASNGTCVAAGAPAAPRARRVRFAMQLEKDELHREAVLHSPRLAGGGRARHRCPAPSSAGDRPD